MASYSISVQRNDGSSALFDFHHGKITIGHQQGEIATLDPLVADPHAELHFDGYTVTYVDSGSPAGSFLPSGERLSAPLALQVGNSVRFGGCTLKIQDIRPDVGGVPTPRQAPYPAAMQPPSPVAPVQAGMQPGMQPPAPAPMQPGMQQPGMQPPAPAPMQPGMAPGPAYGLPAPAASSGQPGEPAQGAGVVDRLMYHLRTASARYKKHYLNGVLTVGLVAIPAALINALLGWIPFVGIIVAILVGIAQLLLIPLSAGAMGRWALATAADQELHWKKAWKNALKDPVQEWLNLFVSQIATFIGVLLLIVPGIIVGMFALPAYLLEGKKFVGIPSRSAELVMKDAGGLIGLGLLSILSFLPMVFIVGIFTAILIFVPVVGEPLTAFLSVALNVLVAPFLYLVWAQVYYSTVRRLEATDPVVDHAATIQSWSAIE
jgi:hypothetical protein